MNGNTSSSDGANEQETGSERVGGSRRFPAPAELKDATAFSQNDQVRDSYWLFDTVRTSPLLGEGFLASMRVNGTRGPKRGRVDWVLLYLDFVQSDSVDVQPWFADADEALFRAAGCERKPCFRTVYDRFVELEGLADELERAAARVIQNARLYEPRIGMYLHVDSTEAETHAALVHACPQDDPNCRVWKERRERARRRLRREAAWGSVPAAAPTTNEDGDDDDPDDETDVLAGLDFDVEIAHSEKRPPRVPTKTVRELRHKAAGEAPPEEATSETGEPVDPLDEGVEVIFADEKEKIIRLSTGCLYRLRDVEAGVRAYTGERGATTFWTGYYNSKATDHCTHAPVAVLVDSASRQEFDLYPDLLERAERNLGVRPRAVVADRGFSVKKVFKFNTERGIASVIHWRKSHPADRKCDTDRYDRHGVPRCQHCGGPTEFVRFHHEPTPRIWFRCVFGPREECRGDQSIACSTDWRALVPLRRDDAVYLELRRSHKSYEAVHDYWRDRYRVAAADIGQRPKRTGRDWQQLRANAALLIEWLRISHMHGWLDNGRRPCRATSRLDRGTPAAERMLQFRTGIGLNGYYGPAAARAFNNRHLRRSPSHTWELRQRWEKRRKERTPRRHPAASA